MIKLKAGQEIISENGDVFKIEEGDCLVENLSGYKGYVFKIIFSDLLIKKEQMEKYIKNTFGYKVKFVKVEVDLKEMSVTVGAETKDDAQRMYNKLTQEYRNNVEAADKNY